MDTHTIQGRRTLSEYTVQIQWLFRWAHFPHNSDTPFYLRKKTGSNLAQDAGSQSLSSPTCHIESDNCYK